ncbi:MAG TPA: Flp family type IVb pilin [Phenylobacterium sp.]|jgi:pilus assembly protein Flp/PilA|nr:Flp family type IVb pilin [Phenylobacterium sp.]
MTKIVSFMRDESGASAAEYVLILAVIGTAVAAACLTFGAAITASLGAAATFLGAHQLT